MAGLGEVYFTNFKPSAQNWIDNPNEINAHRTIAPSRDKLGPFLIANDTVQKHGARRCVFVETVSRL
ncbi:hypothetical protein GCM10023208_25390 [Erythrobacter westpacificensis]|uniref:Uncharacterized protein n=1 Tax=Erythrobacter westpacificensis TaxID=1055231 RepID=A0ABP9KJU3_9SPHN